MVVKGLIKSIDYGGNTCMVRLPVFESAASDKETVVTAIFSNQPGIYNGYKVGDVVIVSFENNDIDMPIVMGKLYLGADVESKDPRGAVNAANVKSSSPISIPIDTELTLNNDPANLDKVEVDGDLASYKSIADIVRGIKKQETQIGAINIRLIDDGENIGAEIARLDEENTLQNSRINQNASSIRSEVSRASQKEGELSTAIEQTATEVRAKVDKVNADPIDPETHTRRGFGWNLDVDSWTIKAYDQDGTQGLPEAGLNIFKIDRESVEINTPTVKLAGYPTTVKTVYLAALKNGPNPTGSTPGWSETMPPHDDTKWIWTATETTTYAYNSAGGTWDSTTAISNITKTEGLDAFANAKTAQETANTAQATANAKSTCHYSATAPSSGVKDGDCWFDTTNHKLKQYVFDEGTQTGSWQDIGGDLVAHEVTAAFINALNITASKITVKDDATPTPNTIFEADSANNEVAIGGFKVDKDCLYTGDLSDLSDTTHAGVYLGTDGILLREPKGSGIGYNEFKVDDGVVTTNNIVATGGTIGGYSIDATSLYSNAMRLDGSTIKVGKSAGSSADNYGLTIQSDTNGKAEFAVNSSLTLYASTTNAVNNTGLMVTRATDKTWKVKARILWDDGHIFTDTSPYPKLRYTVKLMDVPYDWVGSEVPLSFTFKLFPWWYAIDEPDSNWVTITGTFEAPTTSQENYFIDGTAEFTYVPSYVDPSMSILDYPWMIKNDNNETFMLGPRQADPTSWTPWTQVDPTVWYNYSVFANGSQPLQAGTYSLGPFLPQYNAKAHRTVNNLGDATHWWDTAYINSIATKFLHSTEELIVPNPPDIEVYASFDMNYHTLKNVKRVNGFCPVISTDQTNPADDANYKIASGITPVLQEDTWYKINPGFGTIIGYAVAPLYSAPGDSGFRSTGEIDADPDRIQIVNRELHWTDSGGVARSFTLDGYRDEQYVRMPFTLLPYHRSALYIGCDRGPTAYCWVAYGR